jgi:chromosome segregation ATPase
VAEHAKLALHIADQQECTRQIFEGNKEKIINQHYASYFIALEAILGVHHIELIPMIKKIITFATEHKRKTDELTKEVEIMRNEQKTWSKEKNQMQKMQKNEKTLNQRYESMSQQNQQLKSQQKNWQKKESELNDELSKLRQTIESLNSKIQDRDAQHSRDVQSLHDVKRNHSKELSDRQSALQKLKEQLEEKNTSTKKLEQQLAQVEFYSLNYIKFIFQEKRSAQKLAERAKAAEISLVDNRMEQAIKLLERARTDSDPIIKQIEERIEIG